MRIIEEWSHEKMRLTIMVMNGRYSLKVEQNLLEQTYKFRDGQIEGPAHLKTLLKEEFYQACSNSFIHMDLSSPFVFYFRFFPIYTKAYF